MVDEVGIKAASYPTIKRRLLMYAKPEWRQAISGAAAAGAALGPASLVLYDVTTLYFETDAVTVSGSRGSPRNAVWSRRSPLAC